MSDNDSFDHQQPPPDPSKRTVEQWALQKGMLPQLFDAAAAVSDGSVPVTTRHNPEFWRFAGARAQSRWPIGAEVTEAEFDAAVELASQGVSR